MQERSSSRYQLNPKPLYYQARAVHRSILLADLDGAIADYTEAIRLFPHLRTYRL